MSRKTDKEYEEKLNKIWEDYIAPAYENSTDCLYYVKDIANCEIDNVEYIILCESPHSDEIEHKDKDGTPQPLPLVGDSGKSVSEFLFGKKKPIGKWIIEDLQKEEKELPHIAIVNICNVPLQKIDENQNEVKDLNLAYLRDNCKVIPGLRENLKTRLAKYRKAHIIIVCGEFAQAYYNELKNNFNTIKSLYVPHPSRNQWQFIYEHKDDIAILKRLFNK